MNSYNIPVAFMYNDSFIEGSKITVSIDEYINTKISEANSVMVNHDLPYRFSVSVIEKTTAYDDYSLNAIGGIDNEFYNKKSAISVLYDHFIRDYGASLLYFMTGVSSNNPDTGGVWEGTNASAFIVGSNDARYNLIAEIATKDNQDSIIPLSLIHEFGHIMGCGHDWYFSDVFREMYNNAHNRGSQGTLMSYATDRVGYFSSPLLNYPNSNIPMGNEHADNLRFITEKTPGIYENRLHKFCNMVDLVDAPQINLDGNMFDIERPNAPGFVTLSLNDIYNYPEIISPLGLDITITNDGDTLDTSVAGLYKPILKASDTEGRVNYFPFYILVK